MKMLLLAAMMMLSGVAAAQINKCIDKNGKVVGYGNECPAGSRSEQMQIQKAPSGASSSPQKSLGDRDTDFKKRQVQQQEAAEKDAKKTAEAEQRARACEQARTYLKQLEDRQRISKTDPKTGERVFLQDSEYASESAKARAAVGTNCK